MKSDGSSLITLSDGVSDSDLADGAGQIMLEFIRSAYPGLSQTEILDRGDLRRAVSESMVVLQDDSSDGNRMVLVRALRLLREGYYRSLLMEERERVGKAGYRYEAMLRFRERMRKEARDITGLSFG